MRSLSLLLASSLTSLASASQSDTRSSKPSSPLVSHYGQQVAIPNWDLRSSSGVLNVASTSKASYDSSSWHHAPVSRCELMACLIYAGEFNEDQLWYSDNLNDVNWGQFTVPWLYRNVFELNPQKGQHFFLQTNGITSRADIFLNTKQVATKEVQVGAYGGHTYDITDLVAQQNGLVVQAYPTDPNYDFAVGFVDWNPSSPSNGTGVWRNITVKQTGPVYLDTLSVGVNIETPVAKNPAYITLQAMAQNLESHSVQVTVEGTITEAGGKSVASMSSKVTLGPKETKTVQIKHTIQDPNIWWPKQWGGQPLYDASLSVKAGSAVSDVVQSTFGIRNATYSINKHVDGIFHVNGHPFQVLGAGYASDMFLRWDSARWTTMAQYMLDMGLNTVRLEGKMEQPEMYEIADQLGLMMLPGWECCDKWEAWSYNDELSVSPVPVFDQQDYQTINYSMKHEAAVLQPHPSVLGFLIGSDYWPNAKATEIYLDALDAVDWQAGIIASAAKRGYPKATGPGGMKMNGPYDWVSPNYWYDTEPYANRFGAAFGFGSELGSGVGTPELGSLKKFLNSTTLKQLWTKPKEVLFHMSTNVSSFFDRTIYDAGLFNRYGKPKSLDDYLLKAQMMDYEANRAQFEGFSAFWNQDRPATGAIYWMLNDAWPGLHWNLFDYYLHPAGSYFGSKVGSRQEHIVYNYVAKNIWLINHSLASSGQRKVTIDLIDLEGKVISSQAFNTTTLANKAQQIAVNDLGIDRIKNVGLLRLVLAEENGKTLSRNVYWLTSKVDRLDWKNSTWYNTPITSYVDYTALNTMKTATLSVTQGGAAAAPASAAGSTSKSIVLENKSAVPAFFIRLNLVDAKGDDVTPVMWSDNYVTLWPHEKLTLTVSQWGGEGTTVQVSGGNVKNSQVKLS